MIKCSSGVEKTRVAVLRRRPPWQHRAMTPIALRRARPADAARPPTSGCGPGTPRCPSCRRRCTPTRRCGTIGPDAAPGGSGAVDLPVQSPSTKVLRAARVRRDGLDGRVHQRGAHRTCATCGVTIARPRAACTDRRRPGCALPGVPTTDEAAVRVHLPADPTILFVM